MSGTEPESPQVAAWRGEFGDAYTERTPGDEEAVRVRTVMWARVLAPLAGAPPQSILEVGANVGLNLRALRRLTAATLYAVEPNAKARQALIASGVAAADRVLDGTARHIPLGDRAVDLAFTCGVLIHVHPEELLESCREIHRVARRHIAAAEYFSAVPESIEYHGRRELLFKRDFGSFWLDNLPDLRVVDYGFWWKPVSAGDNLTWWLFEKR